ncbi:MAG: type 1 glutamine amidotransferase domain-containing protein, partial [Pantoea sp.]|nr:type 1 glutamine amidotransferase domain-containing protein [Pantoea sp.]
RFHGDQETQAVLAATVRLDSVSQDAFDAVFYPGGHGPLWDLANDKNSIALIEQTLQAGKPVALVCHAPGVLRDVKSADGEPLVKGKKVTGFTNTEEEGVGLTNVVPFLVEDVLKQNGGIYSRGDDWQSYAVQDGLLITGQNPGSSVETAKLLMTQLSN